MPGDPTLAPSSGEAVLDAEGLDRGVGFIGLLWASETSIILVNENASVNPA